MCQDIRHISFKIKLSNESFIPLHIFEKNGYKDNINAESRSTFFEIPPCVGITKYCFVISEFCSHWSHVV